MGVSAVPGSGKTYTLSLLAARLVATALEEDQEVLIVTLVNSAVDTFKRRITQLAPGRALGYRVRTLHGLAHDIVRERPGLAGLAEDFGIADEREAELLRDDAVDRWLRRHPESADPYLAPGVEGRRAQRVKANQWPLLVRDVATAVIRRAKDLGLEPDELPERLGTYGPDDPRVALLRMGAEIYADYQRGLVSRGMVDFDDLVRLAAEVLRRDPDYLARLRHRWPYILEDEAQDSSHGQEAILRLLAGPEGNWVRVGDTNQAIYETFTTANPDLLRAFIREPGVEAVVLEESGRSQPAIIDLANALVHWTMSEHPLRFARENAFIPTDIAPTGPGDPQPNPPLDPEAVRLVMQELAPDQELRFVADSLKRWLAEHPDETAGVLVPHNQRGFELIERLKRRGVPYVELLRSTTVTREAAGVLGNVLRCLADPTSPRKLAVAFRVWRRDDRADPAARAVLNSAVRHIATCHAVEAYLWPRGGHDWLAELDGDASAEERHLLAEFRELAQRWHRAAILPVDQLVVALAADLYRQPADLALSHKLALLLRQVAAAHPGYGLDDLVSELAGIARNERRFLGLAVEDTGFEPPRGAVTVATVHKAKGLEWDRVYLISANNYHFPSGLPQDTFVSERWFVRDGLNLEAEALTQLEAVAAAGAEDAGEARRPLPVEGEATRQARLDYVAERLRLFYVGLTRARRDLIVTWNAGRPDRERLEPALALAALDDSRRR
jgi:DNA helicase-2/ATP-dependent DNA helicase PcrA